MGDKGLLGPGVRDEATEAGGRLGRVGRRPAQKQGFCGGAGLCWRRARPPPRAPGLLPAPRRARLRPLSGPAASRPGTHANKDASIYSPLPGRFLRHSAGTIIKLICI